jgi:osmoprotectant transport system permease protein
MRRVTPGIVSVASLGQAIPSIGVLVLFALVFGIGFRYAVLGLVVYAFLPVLLNTMVGLRQVDSSVIEAGRGMGMTKMAVLFRIELPLAVPIILAGVRTALIIVVGTAALATFINAGGMGDLINNGIKLRRTPVLLTGAVLTAVLALGVDWVAGIAEDVLRPKGL